MQVNILISCYILFRFYSKFTVNNTYFNNYPFINKRPNIIVILTDQERHHMHWPSDWVKKHLPSFERLKKHGLIFNNAFTSASECSPSRAVIMSGNHFPINKIGRTLNEAFKTPL